MSDVKPCKYHAEPAQCCLECYEFQRATIADLRAKLAEVERERDEARAGADAAAGVATWWQAEARALREALVRAIKAAEAWQEARDCAEYNISDERLADAQIIEAAEEMSRAVCREAAALRGREADRG